MDLRWFLKSEKSFKYLQKGGKCCGLHGYGAYVDAYLYDKKNIFVKLENLPNS